MISVGLSELRGLFHPAKLLNCAQNECGNICLENVSAHNYYGDNSLLLVC